MCSIATDWFIGGWLLSERPEKLFILTSKINIREDSMNTLQTIVLPYMVPSMLYQIGF